MNTHDNCFRRVGSLALLIGLLTVGGAVAAPDGVPGLPGVPDLAPAGKPGDSSAVVNVSLSADAAAVAPGRDFHLLVRFAIDEGWHIAARDPGEIGLPTTLSFAPVAGLSFGTPAYPVAKRITDRVGDDEYVVYWYEKKADVVVPVRVAADFKSDGPVKIVLTPSFSACQAGGQCKPPPSGLTVSLTLPTAKADAAPAAPDEPTVIAIKKALNRLPAPIDSANHVRVFASFDRQQLRPGDATTLGVLLDLPEGWHAQSPFTGKSYIPAEIQLDIPDAFGGALERSQKPGENHRLAWPPAKPSATDKDALLYDGRVLVTTRLTVPKDFDVASLRERPILRGTIRLQICDDKKCLPPQLLGFELPVPLAGVSAGSTGSAPTVAPAPAAGAGSTSGNAGTRAAPKAGQPRNLRQRVEALVRAGKIVHVDFTAEWCLNCKFVERTAINVADSQALIKELGVVSLQADWTDTTSDNGLMIGEWLRDLNSSGIPVQAIYPPSQPDKPIVIRDVFTAAQFQESLRAAAAGREAPAELAAPAQAVDLLTLLPYLGIAFVAGLVLNFMPCVLPVLGLKILSFVQQGGDSPRRVFKLGLVFSAGLMTVFVALGAGVAGLIYFGSSYNWGQQFGDARVILALTTVLFVFSLSLLGVWTLQTPDFINELGAGSTGGDQHGEGYAASYFKGMLATALAIPCTGPGLGALIAWAVVQQPHVILLTFSFVGLGMAAPYLILTANPALLKRMPKPGAWMEKFERIMGFVMLASALFFLYSLYANFAKLDEDLLAAKGLYTNFGGRALMGTVGFLLCVGAGVWAIGAFSDPNQRTPRPMVGWVSAGVLALGGYFAFYSYLTPTPKLSVLSVEIVGRQVVSSEDERVLQEQHKFIGVPLDGEPDKPSA